MSLKNFLFYSSFSLMACGYQPVDLPATIKISTQFEIGDAQLILDGIDEWERATNHIAKFKIEFSDNNADGDSIVVLNQTLNYNVMGNTKHNWFSDGSLIRMDAKQIHTFWARRNPTHEQIYIKNVFMHELAHAMFDAVHTTEKNSLMYFQNIEINGCIDKSTLNQFCENYHCKGKEIATCHEN